MGRPNHLQDQETLCLPAGHAQLDAQLWFALRDGSGRFPLLHPRYGQGVADVPAQDQLVVPRTPLLRPHLLLRRD